LILGLSLLPSETNYVIAESNPENITPNNLPQQFTVRLDEEIGMFEIRKTSSDAQHFSISLDEKMSVLSDSHQNDILLIKSDSDKQAIMERIFDRQQKYLKTNSQVTLALTPTKLVYHEYDQISEQSEFEIIQIPDLVIFSEFEKIINDYINIEQLFFSKNSIEQLDQSTDLIFDPNNPILLVLLIPFAGLVLIYYENQQTKFYQIKQIITLSIVIILTASTIITPLSISNSYWNTAFAEESDQIQNTNQADLFSENENYAVLNNFTNTQDYHA